MKIIFLDFDGTIAPLSYHHSSSGFSVSACANVQSLLTKDSEVRIVVSSSWRRWGLEEIRKILKENGIDSTKVIGLTESEGGWDPKNRELQIKEWLKEHPKVKKFVVLDDYPMPELDANSVKMNGYVGFTQKDAETATRILGEDK